MLLEYIVIELGCSAQPLQEDYEKYRKQVTNCWLKSVWEKCSKFGVHVNFGDTPVESPRVGDHWLMKVFEQVGYSGDELRRLNRVRTHHQVLFLLCVLGTSGKLLDKRYLERRHTNEGWSRLDFPNKTPPNKDFTLWRQALKHIVPADGIMDCLGRFNHDSYKM